MVVTTEVRMVTTEVKMMLHLPRRIAAKMKFGQSYAQCNCWPLMQTSLLVLSMHWTGTNTRTSIVRELEGKYKRYALATECYIYYMLYSSSLHNLYIVIN
jgi:hypothetical protein